MNSQHGKINFQVLVKELLTRSPSLIPSHIHHSPSLDYTLRDGIATGGPG